MIQSLPSMHNTVECSDRCVNRVWCAWKCQPALARRSLSCPSSSPIRCAFFYFSALTDCQTWKPATGKLIYCCRTVGEVSKTLEELRVVLAYRDSELGLCRSTKAFGLTWTRRGRAKNSGPQFIFKEESMYSP